MLYATTIARVLARVVAGMNSPPPFSCSLKEMESYAAFARFISSPRASQFHPGLKFTAVMGNTGGPDKPAKVAVSEQQ